MISSAEVESSQRWSAAREGILLVEDDRAIRDALEAILADEGYRVSTAADGQQALDQLHSGQGADLIVLDLRMPVMNGWRFMTGIRRRRIRCCSTFPSWPSRRTGARRPRRSTPQDISASH